MAIVTAGQRAREQGRHLVLLHGAPNVDRLFALTGTTDQVVFFEPSSQRAVA